MALITGGLCGIHSARRTAHGSMAKWYYSAEGHATGPVSEQELGDLASRGVVCTETLIWQPAMEDWEPVWKLKPQIIEQLNKSAMAKQAKGTTDRIPGAPEPLTLEPPAIIAPPAKQAPADEAAAKTAPPATPREKPQPLAPAEASKPGLLQRIFGRKKK